MLRSLAGPIPGDFRQDHNLPSCPDCYLQATLRARWRVPVRCSWSAGSKCMYRKNSHCGLVSGTQCVPPTLYHSKVSHDSRWRGTLQRTQSCSGAARRVGSDANQKLGKMFWAFLLGRGQKKFSGLRVPWAAAHGRARGHPA